MLAELLLSPRISIDFIVTQSFKQKQHRNSESTWKASLEKVQGSRPSGAVGLMSLCQETFLIKCGVNCFAIAAYLLIQCSTLCYDRLLSARPKGGQLSS